MAQPHAGVLELDAVQLPAEHRFPAWASAIPSHTISTPDPLAFTAKATAWHVPPLTVTDTRLAPVRFERTRAHIEADGLDEISAQLILSGHVAGDADGRPFLCTPGDITVQDRARPLTAVVSAHHSVTLLAPRAFFENSLPESDIHGLVLRGAAADLLRGFLAALPATLRQEDALDAADIARIARDLLAATLRQAAEAEPAPEAAALRMRVKRHIAGNLAGALDADSLCAALGVSRSSLYRVMSRDGGVAAAVQRARLARIHWLLSDPAERRSIAALAAEYGFTDRSHFSRLFRRVYGCTPQACRNAAGAERLNPAPGSIQDELVNWAEADRKES